jgi:hypothetical protein
MDTDPIVRSTGVTTWRNFNIDASVKDLSIDADGCSGGS